jgi:hypothetical protein
VEACSEHSDELSCCIEAGNFFEKLSRSELFKMIVFHGVRTGSYWIRKRLARSGDGPDVVVNRKI